MYLLDLLFILYRHALFGDETQYEYSCTDSQNSMAVKEFKRNEWRLSDIDSYRNYAD